MWIAVGWIFNSVIFFARVLDMSNKITVISKIKVQITKLLMSKKTLPNNAKLHIMTFPL